MLFYSCEMFRKIYCHRNCLEQFLTNLDFWANDDMTLAFWVTFSRWNGEWRWGFSNGLNIAGWESFLFFSKIMRWTTSFQYVACFFFYSSDIYGERKQEFFSYQQQPFWNKMFLKHWSHKVQKILIEIFSVVFFFLFEEIQGSVTNLFVIKLTNWIKFDRKVRINWTAFYAELMSNLNHLN